MNLTQKRIKILRKALCYLEAEYEGAYVAFSHTETEWIHELQACHAWLNKVERKRNRKETE
jgi:hypothetical protein